ncbi:MAG: hypothetical protein WBP68_00040, partial [Candidatus Binatus sp.]
MALAVATATICATVIVARASVPAPVLTSARIEHRGPTLELHFGFSGSAPRFHLSTHGSELWIELGRTRVAIPPRPLFGYESAPIMSVRAIQSDSGSRIVVEVTGGTDYAIARLRDRNEIVLRVAATGADPNIAAPIIVHNTPRRPAPPVARQVVYAPAENPRSVPPIPPAAPVPVALNEDNRQPGHFLVMIDPG